MVWEIGKPQRILKGTFGFVYKVKNAHKPTRWWHKAFNSMRNVMNSICHRAFYAGDTVYVYDTSTLELVSVITIRRPSGNVEIFRTDIDKIDEEQAKDIRREAGEYKEA
jgi:hypothetical protein